MSIKRKDPPEDGPEDGPPLPLIHDGKAEEVVETTVVDVKCIYDPGPGSIYVPALPAHAHDTNRIDLEAGWRVIHELGIQPLFIAAEIGNDKFLKGLAFLRISESVVLLLMVYRCMVFLERFTVCVHEDQPRRQYVRQLHRGVATLSTVSHRAKACVYVCLHLLIPSHHYSLIRTQSEAPSVRLSAWSQAWDKYCFVTKCTLWCRTEEMKIIASSIVSCF